MDLPAFMLDPWIRRRARIHAMDTERFTIRLARTAAEYRDAFRLLHVGYVFQGIEPVSESHIRMTEQHVLSEAIVLAAYEDNRIVGTISVTKDSPAGLPIDKDYPRELAELRRGGARISEIGSLAVVRRCWHSSVMPLLGMAAARVGLRVHGSTHVVIGVHPKALPFYRAIWGFEPLGPARPHAELDAPVLGLVAEQHTTHAHLTRCFRRPMRVDGLLPVDYCFGARVPYGLDFPEGISSDEWPRFKMPREVFRELFVERSNRLEQLSTPTAAHLRTQRSEQTVGTQTITR